MKGGFLIVEFSKSPSSCTDSNHPLLSEGLIFKASVSPNLGRSRLRLMRSLSSMVEAAFALRFFDSGGRSE